jgi:predicted amidohydrolase
MQDLSVALIQEDLYWQDPQANRNLFQTYFEELADVDLVVLPEMFTTGFTMAAAEHAETMDGASVAWMKKQTRRYGFALTGSVIIEDQGRYFNRMVLVQAGVVVNTYDKRHLFRMAGEHHSFCPGQTRVVVPVAGWRVALQVCYDLRFPVFSRNRNDYDLVLYVANWPAARRRAWQALLPARAIENLSYCVGVNRVGYDGVGVAYSGDSVIVDYRGDLMASAGEHAGIARAQLSAAGLAAFRDKFPAHLDGDGFQIEGLNQSAE